MCCKLYKKNMVQIVCHAFITYSYIFTTDGLHYNFLRDLDTWQHLLAFLFKNFFLYICKNANNIYRESLPACTGTFRSFIS